MTLFTLRHPGFPLCWQPTGEVADTDLSDLAIQANQAVGDFLTAWSLLRLKVIHKNRELLRIASVPMLVLLVSANNFKLRVARAWDLGS